MSKIILYLCFVIGSFLYNGQIQIEQQDNFVDNLGAYSSITSYTMRYNTCQMSSTIPSTLSDETSSISNQGNYNQTSCQHYEQDTYIQNARLQTDLITNQKANEESNKISRRSVFISQTDKTLENAPTHRKHQKDLLNEDKYETCTTKNDDYKLINEIQARKIRNIIKLRQEQPCMINYNESNNLRNKRKRQFNSAEETEREHHDGHLHKIKKIVAFEPQAVLLDAYSQPSTLQLYSLYPNFLNPNAPVTTKNDADLDISNVVSLITKPSLLDHDYDKKVTNYISIDSSTYLQHFSTSYLYFNENSKQVINNVTTSKNNIQNAEFLLNITKNIFYSKKIALKYFIQNYICFKLWIPEFDINSISGILNINYNDYYDDSDSDIYLKNFAQNNDINVNFTSYINDIMKFKFCDGFYDSIDNFTNKQIKTGKFTFNSFYEISRKIPDFPENNTMEQKNIIRNKFFEILNAKNTAMKLFFPQCINLIKYLFNFNLNTLDMRNETCTSAYVYFLYLFELLLKYNFEEAIKKQTKKIKHSYTTGRNIDKRKDFVLLKYQKTVEEKFLFFRIKLELQTLLCVLIYPYIPHDTLNSYTMLTIYEKLLYFTLYHSKQLYMLEFNRLFPKNFTLAFFRLFFTIKIVEFLIQNNYLQIFASLEPLLTIDNFHYINKKRDFVPKMQAKSRIYKFLCIFILFFNESRLENEQNHLNKDVEDWFKKLKYIEEYYKKNINDTREITCVKNKFFYCELRKLSRNALDIIQK
ncbi:hypothetical protein COBT_002813 [Conglomerata obtusa]